MRLQFSTTVQGVRQWVKKPLLGYLTAVGHRRIFFSVSGTVELCYYGHQGVKKFDEVAVLLGWDRQIS